MEPDKVKGIVKKRYSIIAESDGCGCNCDCSSDNSNIDLAKSIGYSD